MFYLTTYIFIYNIKPLITDVDISQIIQRPLAIPKDISKARETWYSNKVFMSFNYKDNVCSLK